MARATRSTALHQEKGKEKEKLHSDSPTVPVTPRSKLATKKRKRGSIQDTEDQPAVKQLRPDPALKPEGSVEPDSSLLKDSNLPRLQNAGDVSIDPSDARKILDVLEMIDTQGLLDRVFPLSTESPNSRPASLSFRTLLKDYSQHPLSILRSAVRHLLPISSHPRSRPSTPAAQQLRFCNLALSLLDQASFNSVPFRLDIQTILPHPPESSSDDAAKLPNGDSNTPHAVTLEPTSPSPPRIRKYALLQRLSNGEWWTSLNSGNAIPPSDGKDIKDLQTGFAELVSIMPSLSVATENNSSSSKSTTDVPTIRSLATQKTPAPKSKLLGPRRVSCGTFLDYGPFASFAPSWDQDGAEIGRRMLGEVVWNTEEKKRKRRSETTKFRVEVHVHSEPIDVTMHDEIQECPQNERNLSKDAESSLEGLLPPDEVASFTSALGSLELECAVHELLQRNCEALKRLPELQRQRLSKENGGLSQAEEGSEEWETAQEIMKSLTLLASLRPRSSGDTSATPPLIPSPSLLRRLYATLPLAHTRGWHGTIYSTRTTALRDDATVRIQSGANLPTTTTTSTPAATSTATTSAATSNTTPASVYPGYPYTNYAASQYRSGYTPYKPAPPAYYPTSYATPHASGQSQVGTQTAYYANQGYGTAGQQTYPYGSWYSYQPPPNTTATAPGTSSGRGTPQPATSVTATTNSAASTGTALPTNYAGFFSNTVHTLPSTTQRAVANTVVGSKPIGTAYTSSNATGTAGYVAPTLPPYLRGTTAASTSQPATGTTTTGGYKTSYYGPYAQSTSSVAE